VGAQPRLTLRPLTAADAAAYAEAAAEEPGEPAALSAAVEPFDAAAEIAAWEPDPLRDAFAVEAAGRLVGIVSLQVSGPGQAEAAYWVRRSQRGRGLATEALGLLTGLAWKRGYERLWLEIDPWNDASLRVADKAGYRYERDEGSRRIFVVLRPAEKESQNRHSVVTDT
jgi:RimJ/RimL family protein N-acetyltransferase